MKHIARAMEGLPIPDIEELLAAPPLTEVELAHFNSLRAAEMARAEKRRTPSPQLDLGEVA